MSMDGRTNKARFRSKFVRTKEFVKEREVSTDFSLPRIG